MIRFLPAFLVLIAALPASAAVTLNQSTQSFTLTGIGPDGSGNGQSKTTFGACAFDGTTTTCTVSGTYTNTGSGDKLGSAGTYAFVISYGGNGAFPLVAVNPPGSNFFSYSAISNFNFLATLTPTGGAPVNFYSFYGFSFFYITPACTGVPASNCSVSAVGAAANATITGPINGSFDTAPFIRTSAGVISAGGYGGFSAIAPATWIEIYGFNLANILTQTWAASDFSGNTGPQTLGGTSVTVAGKPAYVDYVSPGQVNVQVPSGIATGLQPVVVTTAGGSSVVYSVQVNKTEPGLLALPTAPFLVSGRQNIVATEAGTLIFILPNAFSGIQTQRAKVGDNLTLYGIGFGSTTPDIPAGQLVQGTNQFVANVQITFNGVPATITYDGLTPSIVGLAQFNVVVPQVAASDSVPVHFSVDGAPDTQNLVIAIQ